MSSCTYNYGAFPTTQGWAKIKTSEGVCGGKINSILLQVKMCLAQKTPKQLKGSQFNLHHLETGTSSVPASHCRGKSKTKHCTFVRSWFTEEKKKKQTRKSFFPVSLKHVLSLLLGRVTYLICVIFTWNEKRERMPQPGYTGIERDEHT